MSSRGLSEVVRGLQEKQQLGDLIIVSHIQVPDLAKAHQMAPQSAYAIAA